MSILEGLHLALHLVRHPTLMDAYSSSVGNKSFPL